VKGVVNNVARKRNNERGSALVLALILTLVLSVMGASLMFLSQSETWSSMNYRMMSQSRYGAESGLSMAADFLVEPTPYTAPAATGPDPLSNYNTTVSPVTYNNAPVVLSTMSEVPSNYPVGAVVTAFQNALTNPGSVTAGNTNVNYAATATLLSMGTVMSYGTPLPCRSGESKRTAPSTVCGSRKKS
jgi:Tfp pilus assembly protein PilX